MDLQQNLKGYIVSYAKTQPVVAGLLREAVNEIKRLEGERDDAREAAKLLWQVAMYEMAYSPSALLAESPWLEDE